MLRKVGELKVDTSIDCLGKVAEALILCGYTLILNYKTYGTSVYDIAIEETMKVKNVNTTSKRRKKVIRNEQSS